MGFRKKELRKLLGHTHTHTLIQHYKVLHFKIQKCDACLFGWLVFPPGTSFTGPGDVVMARREEEIHPLRLKRKSSSKGGRGLQ